MQLQTDRLNIRPFKLTDLDSFHEIQLSCHLSHRNTIKQGISSSAQKFLDAIQNTDERCGYWAIDNKEEQRFLGYCKLCFNEFEEIEVDYDFLVEEQQKGFQVEVLLCLADYAFNQLETTTICCMVHKENNYLIKTLEKLGFEVTALSSTKSNIMVQFNLSQKTFKRYEEH